MDYYLIKYLSFKKVANLIKVYVGLWLSIILRRVILPGNPYSLTTEPTNLCNLNCLECPTGNLKSLQPKGHINIDLYKKVIDEVKGYIIYHMIYFQGEPFLYPKLFELIKYADQNKIYTCTSTNGHYLSIENCEKLILSGLKKLIISVDGITQETYSKYRVGGSIDKVIQGVKNIVELKRKYHIKYPLISLQFIVFRHNQHEINEFKKLSKYLGVDKAELKSAQIENFEQNHNLIPSLRKYARYTIKNNQLKIKNKLKNKCSRIWTTLLMRWDGNILPCCFDKYSNFVLGNAEKSRLLNIWKTSVFNDFRLKILSSRKKIAICRNCTEGLRIKM